MGFDHRSRHRNGSSHDPAIGRGIGTPGKRTLTETLPRGRGPIQAKLEGAPGGPAAEAARATPTTSGGEALPDPVRERMEQAIGADLASVRVHTDASPQAIGAAAYTRGEDVHFAPGRWDPESDAGQRLIAHELAHVLQQREGRVAVPQGEGEPGSTAAINADPSLEAEADAVAERAMAPGARGGSAPGGPARPAGTPVIQRQLVPDMQNQKEMRYHDTRDTVCSPAHSFERVDGDRYREVTYDVELTYDSGTRQYKHEGGSYYDIVNHQWLTPMQEYYYDMESRWWWYSKETCQYELLEETEDTSRSEKEKEKTEDSKKRKLEELTELSTTTSPSGTIDMTTYGQYASWDNWKKIYYFSPTQKDKKKALQCINAHLMNEGTEREGALLVLAWCKQYDDDPITFDDLGGDGSKIQRGLDRLLRGEEEKTEENVTKERKLERKPPEVEIDGKARELKLFSEVGGYHVIYEFVDEELQDWLVRVPTSQSPLDVARGMAQYEQLEKRKVVMLPNIANRKQAKNGKSCYYLVERIPTGCDTSIWRDKKVTFNKLDKQYQHQLKQIREVLDLNASKMAEIVPDFRPDNIRFKLDGQLVLIDFSEVPDEYDDQDAFAGRMDSLVREFAGEYPTNAGNFNQDIYEFLTAVGLKDHRKRMLESRQKLKSYYF